MKKSLVALAILASISAIAHAEVTLYGIVDAGIASDSGTQRVTKLESGVESGSRLGFKGTEDLGGGLKANFVLENGFSTTNGQSLQGALFGRQSYVGVSNDMGSLTLGRQYTSVYTAVKEIADPFNGGLAGNAFNLFSDGGKRINNSVRFGSANYSGFSGDLMYSFGNTSPFQASRTVSGSVGYDQGPVAVRLATQNTQNGLASDSSSVTSLSGSYDFKVAKASVALAKNSGFVGGADSRDMLVGVSVPFGATKLMASYIHKDDRSVANANANQFGIGADYTLSKRTNLYMSYAKINNSNGATYTVGNASDLGSGDSQFNAGVRHSF
jgi:predicted porin